MADKWDEFAIEQSPWEQFAVQEETPKPTVSRSEAAGRGFANTASFGLGKWVYGMMTAAEDEAADPRAQAAIQERINSLPEGSGLRIKLEDDLAKRKRFAEYGIHREGRTFWDNVLGHVEGQKAANALAMEQRPGYYITGAAAPLALGAGVNIAGRGVTTGLGAGITAPTTAVGRIAAGAATGAATGATESTSLDQLALNVGTGTVVGGALAGVPAIFGAAINKFGRSSVLKDYDELLKLAKSSDAIVADDAVKKLQGLFGFKLDLPTLSADQKKQLIDRAGQFRTFFERAVSEGSSDSDTARRLAQYATPTFGQLGSEAVETAVKGSMAAIPGAIAGHTLDAALPGSGVLVGSGLGALAGAYQPSQRLLGDVAKWGAITASGSPTFQSALRVSPLIGGSVAGQTVEPLGLSGALGQYIDNTWRK